jgi:hypothetical protein
VNRDHLESDSSLKWSGNRPSSLSNAGDRCDNGLVGKGRSGKGNAGSSGSDGKVGNDLTGRNSMESE